MELPFTIVFEAPSRAELRAALRGRWMVWLAAAALLAVSVGLSLVVVSASRAEALATSTPSFTIQSRPSGAEIWLDGHKIGQTPLATPVAPGHHSLELKSADAAGTTYSVDVGAADGAFDALLWRRQPLLARLRSPVPGAALASAQLLRDGSLSLGVSVTPEQELQAWRVDAATGTPDLLLSGIVGVRPSLAPDAAQVAYAGRAVGPPWPGARASDVVLWLTRSAQPAGTPTALWTAPAGETIVDLTWAPHGRSLIASTATMSSTLGSIPDLSSGPRSRLWLIDMDTRGARQLVSLPSQIVPGSISWSPNGQRLAFLAHAGALNALCLLDLDGEFRYLADLEASETMVLEYPPLAWTADGARAVFAAPPLEAIQGPGTWLQPGTRRRIYTADESSSAPRALGDADAALATFREDGQLLALVRTRDGTVALDTINSGGQSQRLAELPLRVGQFFSAQWDVLRGRVLVASRSGRDAEYWLIRLGLEDQS